MYTAGVWVLDAEYIIYSMLARHVEGRRQTCFNSGQALTPGYLIVDLIRLPPIATRGAVEMIS